VLDATEHIAHQDAVVAGSAEERGRPVVLALTKWDVVADPKKRAEEIAIEVADRFKFLPGAARVTVSGKTGRGLPHLLAEVKRVAEASRRRVPTPKLNRFVERRLSSLSLPAPGAQSGHILYATQTGTAPPTFTFFVNRRVAVHFSTRRFVVNQLREEFNLAGIPVRANFRSSDAK
jgi:GTP-binding protein